MNKSVTLFDGLDHQNTPDKELHQIDAHVIFTMGEQPLDPAAFKEWQRRKVPFIQFYLSGIVVGWFLRLLESYKNDWFDFVSAFKKHFCSQKTGYYAKVKAQALKLKN